MLGKCPIFACVEGVSIPKTVESGDLEHTACKVFNSIGFDIGEDRIEVFLRLTKSARTIVKFSQSKKLSTINAY